MSAERGKFSAEDEVRVLNRHLVDKVPVSTLGDQQGPHPTLFNNQQKDFFEDGAAALDGKNDAKQTPMDFSRISIIILTKNAGRLFPKMLEGLFACTGIDETEIILIDSGSEDLTLEYAARYPRIKVHRILPAEFGHGRTRNLGARLAQGDILIYLVQDATPAAPDFLTRLTAPLSDSRVAAVYGRQLPQAFANPVEQFFLGETYPAIPRKGAYTASSKATIRNIFFSNVCSAIRRQVWARVPFDESLIMSEDQQWAKEVLTTGFLIIYEPGATVWHSHNYRLKQVLQRN
ncbi:MAG: glycosyltransferase family 2 protein, partial [Deltaproteobacteria bacterium]|nr:glycosyltransferase family 2 protein [Deltaproteobacteria bacterium]